MDTPEKEVVYPAEVTTWVQKIKHSNDVKEKIRQDYIAKKVAFDDGKITQKEFDEYNVIKEANYSAVGKAIGDIKQHLPQALLDEIDLDVHTLIDKVIFPAFKITHEDQLSTALAAREKMRLDHNVRGKAFRDGKTSYSQWIQFKDSFDAKSLALSTKINELKDNPPQADVDKIVITDTIKDKIVAIKL